MRISDWSSDVCSSDLLGGSDSPDDRGVAPDTCSRPHPARRRIRMSSMPASRAAGSTSSPVRRRRALRSGLAAYKLDRSIGPFVRSAQFVLTNFINNAIDTDIDFPLAEKLPSLFYLELPSPDFWHATKWSFLSRAS